MERETTLIDLSARPVEYRLEERGPRVVLILHGGHMRAGLPLGEEGASQIPTAAKPN